MKKMGYVSSAEFDKTQIVYNFALRCEAKLNRNILPEESDKPEFFTRIRLSGDSAV
jgi:hypothetical protein